MSKKRQISNSEYLRELKRLQGELVVMLEWIKKKNLKVAVVFEGRDAAGKGGVISRISQYLSPRYCRVAALPAPTTSERGSWYFQRYIKELPTQGELVLFDRSWYNRAGVERVMGFCTDDEYWEFLHSCPQIERMWARSGIQLIKYWFSVSRKEQERRFQGRLEYVHKRWKLSDIDLESRKRWVEFSRAKDEMFRHTDIPEAPWHVVNGEVKKLARLNCIRHLLSMIRYENVFPKRVKLEKIDIEDQYERPPREYQTMIPETYK